MNKITFQLETLSCPSCTAKIEGSLGKAKGVESLEVLFNSSKVKVDFDENQISIDEMKKIIRKVGFIVLGQR